MSDAIPAATLILLRDRAGAAPELLMVRRAPSMAFAAGAWVFPGGRIDPEDHALAAAIAPDLEDGAARVAAIRETLEETGVAVGFDAGAADTLRAALHAGVGFEGALARTGTKLDLAPLIPFARWRPDHRPSRIFDARFYLARAPEHAPVQVDGTENTHAAWTTAADLLARADRGEAAIIFPTRRNLERLATFPDFAAARAHALAHPVRTIVPFSETRGGVEHLCIPDDLGYPITSEPLADAVRG